MMINDVYYSIDYNKMKIWIVIKYIVSLTESAYFNSEGSEKCNKILASPKLNYYIFGILLMASSSLHAVIYGYT